MQYFTLRESCTGDKLCTILPKKASFTKVNAKPSKENLSYYTQQSILQGIFAK